MRVRLARWTGSLTLAAAWWLAGTSAAAHPIIDVANPRPNDRATAGSLVMQGVAYDHDARAGSGVDSVSVRICGPDGQHLGDAVLGLPSPVSLEHGDARYATAGWKVTVLLKGAGDLRELCVTARSSVTGTQTLVRIPITIGSKPPAPPAADAALDEDSGPSATPPRGASPAPLPGASATPIPGASATPIPGASPAPSPGASTTPLPGASPAPLPSATPGVAPTATPSPPGAPSPVPTPDPEEEGPD